MTLRGSIRSPTEIAAATATAGRGVELAAAAVALGRANKRGPASRADPPHAGTVEPACAPADAADTVDALAAGAKRRGRDATPAQRALGLLVRREHSRKELLRKLVDRGIAADAAADAVDRLAADGWQDDARFAESLLRTRANHGYGPLRIAAELGTHGLDRDAVAAVMDTFEGDWLDNARDLVRRRFGVGIRDDRALQRKAADFLLRRGFSAEHARTAIRPGT